MAYGQMEIIEQNAIFIEFSPKFELFLAVKNTRISCFAFFTFTSISMTINLSFHRWVMLELLFVSDRHETFDFEINDVDGGGVVSCLVAHLLIDSENWMKFNNENEGNRMDGEIWVYSPRILLVVMGLRKFIINGLRSLNLISIWRVFWRLYLFLEIFSKEYFFYIFRLIFMNLYKKILKVY